MELLLKRGRAKEQTEIAQSAEQNKLNDLEDYLNGRAGGLTESEVDAKIATAIANANKEEILWTNPNPTGGFAPQTISWTSTEYNRFYVITKSWKDNSDGQNNKMTLFMPGRESELFQAWYDNGGNYFRCAQRRGTMNSQGTQISFTNSTFFQIEGSSHSKTTNNETIIPLYVVGYKAVVNF